VEGLRIELPRRKVPRSEKLFRIGFFLDVKCSHGRLFIYGYSIGVEFLILRTIPQSQVRFEQTIDQLRLLFLSVDVRQRGEKRRTDQYHFSHDMRLVA